jgi:type I restriction enzyme S subunit
VTPEFDGWFLSPVFPTFRANRGKLEPAYLDWFCKRKSVWAELQRKSRGIGARRESVLPEQFLSLEIPLPPLAEQQRIVARIEELATQIQEARTLRQQAQEEEDSLIQAFGKRLFAGPMKTVGDVAEVTKLAGFEYTKYLVDAPEGDVILVRAGNVRNSGLDLSNAATIPSEISDLLPRSQLKTGDVVMTFIGAKIGDVAYVRPDNPRMHCGPNVAKLTTRIGLDHHYLAVALRSIVVQDQIRRITKLTAQPNLSMKTIRQLIIPVPSLQEQQRIISQLDTLQGEVDVLKRLQAETAAELDALLPSILDRAFKGEL